MIKWNLWYSLLINPCVVQWFPSGDICTPGVLKQAPLWKCLKMSIKKKWWFCAYKLETGRFLPHQTSHLNANLNISAKLIKSQKYIFYINRRSVFQLTTTSHSTFCTSPANSSVPTEVKHFWNYAMLALIRRYLNGRSSETVLVSAKRVFEMSECDIHSSSQ